MLKDSEIKSLFSLRYNIYSKPFYPEKTIKDYEPMEKPKEGWDYHIEDFLKLILNVNLSDHDKIGISLSGGLDSTLLLAIIRKVFPEKKIFCIHDVCSGETEFARDVAERYGAEFMSVTRDSIIDEIPLYVAITEEPRWNVYHHAMAVMARNMHCDIMVTGDGADELFGGYVFRYQKFESGADYLQCHKNDWVDDMDELFVGGCQWFKGLQYQWDRYGVENLNHVLMQDYNGKLLRDSLPVSHKISKWYGIPIYAPYMELRDFASHIPLSENYDGKTGKNTLRTLARRYDLPVNPKKIGYSFDVVKDFTDNNEFYHVALKGVSQDTWSIINKNWLVKHKNSRDIRDVYKFLQILALGYYLK